MSRFEKLGQQQFSALVEHLERFMQKKELEDLHKIRVNIKKIKAILLFVNDRVKGFRAHKNYIPLRTIFRRAGEIREPEVVSGLLLAHNIPGVHDKKLDGNREKIVESFCEDIPSFIYAANEQWGRLKPLFRKLKKKDLEQYLRKTKKDIKTKLYPKPDMDIIHTVRKSMKGFIYLSEANHRPSKKLMKFFTKQVEVIGDLHDHQVLLNLMSRQNGHADRVLIKKIQQECDQKKDEIKKAARTFYNS